MILIKFFPSDFLMKSDQNLKFADKLKKKKLISFFNNEIYNSVNFY